MAFHVLQCFFIYYNPSHGENPFCSIRVSWDAQILPCQLGKVGVFRYWHLSLEKNVLLSVGNEVSLSYISIYGCITSPIAILYHPMHRCLSNKKHNEEKVLCWCVPVGTAVPFLFLV